MEFNIIETRRELQSAQASLKDATEKWNDSFKDVSTTPEQRAALKKDVTDLEDRVSHYQTQVDNYEKENKTKLAAQNEAQMIAAAQASNTVSDAQAAIVNNKANVIQNVMKNQGIPQDSIKALGGSYTVNALKARKATPVNALKADGTTGGSNLLPTTSSAELITEPFTTNKLRNYVTVSRESNLEIPKLAFSCADDEFVADGETAKEIELTGSKVTFGRFESKVFADVTDTMLLGTNTNLVEAVDNGLDSGVQSKEKKMMFAKSTDAWYKPATKHMSFYETDGQSTPSYLIKSVSGSTMYDAITNAIADLHEDFRENAAVIMRYADYIKMLKTLANGSQTLFGVQPEAIIGKPVIFMDSATIPVVGNLNYLQINYFPDTVADRDKNIKTGMTTFALTAWYDIQFRLRSAFRLAEVVGE